MIKKYGNLRTFSKFLGGLRGRGTRYIFHGTEAEWEALSDKERNKYDQAELTDPAFRYIDNMQDSLPTGAVVPYAGTIIPAGWLACEGQEVSRITYAALFEAIGTSYGAGDGATTFRIPDYREAALVGIGQRASGVADHDVYTLGQFKDDQLQDHRHYRFANKTAPNGWSISIGIAESVNWAMVDTGTVNNGAEMGGVVTNEPDRTYGKGRAGTVTRGKRMGVNYIIKWRRQGSVDIDIDVDTLINQKIAAAMTEVDKKLSAQKKDVTVSAYMDVLCTSYTNDVSTYQRATTIYFDNIEWSDYKIVIPRCLVDGSCVLLNARPEGGRLVMDLYYTGQDTQLIKGVAFARNWFYTLDLNDTSLFTKKTN